VGVQVFRLFVKRMVKQEKLPKTVGGKTGYIEVLYNPELIALYSEL
jgi:hypothetical protein